ncbi:MAG: YcaO-like family protein [Chitinophagaceae bacterium]|nr:YcaO-like family protein [Chitinophagaceae bacterium]
MVIAASTDYDLSLAIKRAIIELFHAFESVNDVFQKMDCKEKYLDKNNVLSQLDHIIFWLKRTNLNYINSYFDNTKTIGFYEKFSNFSIQKKLDMLIQNFSKLKIGVFYKDLTTVDIKKLGLTVVRVVIPQCQPLSFGHSYRYLGGDRLRRFYKAYYNKPFINDSDMPCIPMKILKYLWLWFHENSKLTALSNKLLVKSF